MVEVRTVFCTLTYVLYNVYSSCTFYNVTFMILNWFIITNSKLNYTIIPKNVHWCYIILIPKLHRMSRLVANTRYARTPEFLIEKSGIPYYYKII